MVVWSFQSEMDESRRLEGKFEKIEHVHAWRGDSWNTNEAWLVDPRNEPVSSEQNELINPPETGHALYASLDNYSCKCAHTCTRQVPIPTRDFLANHLAYTIEP